MGTDDVSKYSIRGEGWGCVDYGQQAQYVERFKYSDARSLRDGDVGTEENSSLMLKKGG